MNIRVLAVCLTTACGLWGCTQAPPPVAEKESALRDQATEIAPTIEAPNPPPPSILLSGTPGADALAVPASCHTPFMCNRDIYGSCADWSPLAFCGDTCTKRCCHDSRCNEPDIGGTVYQEQYQD